MSGLLTGRVAAITGAAGGIGRAVAEAFASEGARVALIDLPGARLDWAEGRDVFLPVPLDVTDEAETDRAAEAVAERLGIADIIVPNAGILHLEHTVDIPLDIWRRVIDVNLTGAFITAKAFTRPLLAAGRPGQVIFTSSLFGLRGGRENAAYSASKFGMVGLAQSLAAEVAGQGVRVNCVCPGQMDTDMIRQLFRDRAELTGSTEAAVADRLISRIPSGALGRMDELAGTYVWLASDLSRYVTGQSIVVDGGWQVG